MFILNEGSDPCIVYRRTAAIDSPPGGNGSGRFDPGESGYLVSTLANIAHDAEGVTATLRSTDSRFVITDSTADYGDIPFGATQSNSTDRFAASAGESIPWGTVVLCSLLVHSSNWAHDWVFPFNMQIGDPPPPARELVTLDTGLVALSACGSGSIGYDEPGGQGSGFLVPKAAASCLRFGSMLAGNSGDYLVDHFYGQPSSQTNHDWQMADSFRLVQPCVPADEQWTSTMTDAGHPSPKGLGVRQRWYMNTGNTFAIVTYDFENKGAAAINGLYAGLIADFNVGETPTLNMVSSDTTRRAIWMRQITNYNPLAGLVVLEPTRFANLTAVDHALYVNPGTAMTDTQKYWLLSGEIVQRKSDRSYDWSVIVSVGPFDLPVGGQCRAAFAAVGAASQAMFDAAVDGAQQWFNDNLSGIAEGQTPGAVTAGQPLLLSPNPFSRGTMVRYFSQAAGPAEFSAYDAGGRQVERVVFSTDEGSGQYFWQPRKLAPGVYFLKVKTAGRESVAKALVLE